MKTKNKVLCILICIIIIVGVVMWKNNGFNLELQYSARNQINISNNKGINKTDIEQIVSEVLEDTRYVVQEIETFGNSISIVADNITEEQRNQIVEKFNEKYESDIKTENIEIISIPFTRIKDVIKPFIIPSIITSIIILAYFVIRYRIIGIKQILAKTVIIPIIAELLLYSIIAIARIPFGRIAVACGIGLYAIIIAILTNKFENDIANKKAESQKQ